MWKYSTLLNKNPQLPSFRIFQAFAPHHPDKDHHRHHHHSDDWPTMTNGEQRPEKSSGGAKIRETGKLLIVHWPQSFSIIHSSLYLQRRPGKTCLQFVSKKIVHVFTLWRGIIWFIFIFTFVLSLAFVFVFLQTNANSHVCAGSGYPPRNGKCPEGNRFCINLHKIATAVECLDLYLQCMIFVIQRKSLARPIPSRLFLPKHFGFFKGRV